MTKTDSQQRRHLLKTAILLILGLYLVVTKECSRYARKTTVTCHFVFVYHGEDMQICNRSSTIIHNCKIKQAMPGKKKKRRKR